MYTRFCRFILDTNEPPSEVHGFEIFSKKEKSLDPLKPCYSAGCKPDGTEHIPFPFALPEAGLACMTVTAI